MERIKNDIYLPNEIVNEILLRLPAKSLTQCKCVCKSWKNLIQNPNFVTDHFHHPQNPNRLFSAICKQDDHDHDHVFKLFTDESLLLRQDLQNPITKPNEIDVIRGPINGLYYMSYYDTIVEVFHQALWNPCTSEFRELPLPPSSAQVLTTNSLHFEEYLGFGSVSNDIKDIKVIMITIFLMDTDYFSGSRDAVIELYSLNDDCWKGIEYDSVRFPFLVRGHPLEFTHLNGVFYWVITIDDHDVLLLFDMKCEEFREVNLPVFGSNAYVESICVHDNSSIVLFVDKYLNSGTVLENVDLWEMKEEGKWSKLLSFDSLSAYVRFTPSSYGFWRKDEILIKTEDEKVVLYNMNSHEIRVLEIDVPNKLFLLNYKESLTSVKGGNGTR